MHVPYLVCPVRSNSLIDESKQNQLKREELFGFPIGDHCDSMINDYKIVIWSKIGISLLIQSSHVTDIYFSFLTPIFVTDSRIGNYRYKNVVGKSNAIFRIIWWDNYIKNSGLLFF